MVSFLSAFDGFCFQSEPKEAERDRRENEKSDGEEGTIIPALSLPPADHGWVYVGFMFSREMNMKMGIKREGIDTW